MIEFVICLIVGYIIGSSIKNMIVNNKQYHKEPCIQCPKCKERINGIDNFENHRNICWYDGKEEVEDIKEIS